jgi:hypothetical protein
MIAGNFTTVVSEHALYLGQAKDILRDYLQKHSDTLSHDEKVALRFGILALGNGIDEEVKAWIAQLGLLFWAEIFSAEGSKCQDCLGGFCHKYDGTYCDPLERCGYCYCHFDEGNFTEQRVCIKTERAQAAHESGEDGIGATFKATDDLPFLGAEKPSKE